MPVNKYLYWFPNGAYPTPGDDSADAGGDGRMTQFKGGTNFNNGRLPTALAAGTRIVADGATSDRFFAAVPALAIDSTGNLYAGYSGWTDGKPYLAKFDANGNQIYETSLYDASDNTGGNIDVISLGTLYGCAKYNNNKHGRVFRLSDGAYVGRVSSSVSALNGNQRTLYFSDSLHSMVIGSNVRTNVIDLSAGGTASTDTAIGTFNPVVLTGQILWGNDGTNIAFVNMVSAAITATALSFSTYGVPACGNLNNFFGSNGTLLTCLSSAGSIKWTKDVSTLPGYSGGWLWQTVSESMSYDYVNHVFWITHEKTSGDFDFVGLEDGTGNVKYGPYNIGNNPYIMADVLYNVMVSDPTQKAIQILNGTTGAVVRSAFNPFSTISFTGIDYGWCVGFGSLWASHFTATPSKDGLWLANG